MRYLTIVRHCKSTPALAGTDDYSRTLSSRGRREAQDLRGWALDSQELGRFGPVAALVSTARRTRETFELAFAATDFVADVYYSDAIYNGRRDVSGEDIVRELAAIDQGSNSLMVVAHNPSVHELVYLLARREPPELAQGFPVGVAVVLAWEEGHELGTGGHDVAAVYGGLHRKSRVD